MWFLWFLVRCHQLLHSLQILRPLHRLWRLQHHRPRPASSATLHSPSRCHTSASSCWCRGAILHMRCRWQRWAGCGWACRHTRPGWHRWQGCCLGLLPRAGACGKVGACGGPSARCGWLWRWCIWLHVKCMQCRRWLASLVLGMWGWYWWRCGHL